MEDERERADYEEGRKKKFVNFAIIKWHVEERKKRTEIC